MFEPPAGAKQGKTKKAMDTQELFAKLYSLLDELEAAKPKKQHEKKWFQEVEPSIEITPLAVIFYSLGGFSAQLRGEQALEQANDIEQRLVRFMQSNHGTIETGHRGRLVFTQKA